MKNIKSFAIAFTQSNIVLNITALEKLVIGIVGEPG